MSRVLAAVLLAAAAAGSSAAPTAAPKPAATPAAAPGTAPAAGPAVSGFDETAAERFAALALACVHKEYPNKIGFVFNGDGDVKPPRELTPAFYGCFDWHSCVHGHWLLARLARLFPKAKFAAGARAALDEDLTEKKLAVEAASMLAPGRTSFERPYGLAWLLQLDAELRDWDDPDARRWLAALKPLEAVAVKRLKTWLPNLTRPIRIGEHDQTAFAFGLVWDWAQKADDQEMLKLLRERGTAYYSADKDCPLSYEPSGQDFLSPCLAEADFMRRVLPKTDYPYWLLTFLPTLGRADQTLRPAVVTDRSDPKLAHLDGLNLSRAWMLEGIASALPPGDTRLPAIRAAAKAHRDAGLAAVTGEHYEGGHWLGSFGVYLASERGLR